MPNVIGYRLLFTMVKEQPVGYYEYGDNSKTPPNAPHCLLLWRKPPLSSSLDGGNALIFSLIEIQDLLFKEVVTGLLIGNTIKKELPLPTVDSTQIRPWCVSTILFTMASPSPEPGCLSMFCPR